MQRKKPFTKSQIGLFQYLLSFIRVGNFIENSLILDTFEVLQQNDYF